MHNKRNKKWAETGASVRDRRVKKNSLSGWDLHPEMTNINHHEHTYREEHKATVG